MPTRDRSLLGVGDPRPPEPRPAAANVSLRSASERDEELRVFARLHPGLRRLAARLEGEDAADELLTEAVARCLLRRPLVRWDPTDLEIAVVVAAETPRDPGRRLPPPTGPSPSTGSDEADAAALLEAAHRRVACGVATGPVVRERRTRLRTLAVVVVLLGFAASLAIAGAATTPGTGGPLGPDTAPQVGRLARSQLPVPGTLAPDDPHRFWAPYSLRFSRMPGIEVPQGDTYIDGDPTHARPALLGAVAVIAAEPAGPPIGYHHQYFGYLPAWIVDQPDFEWVDWYLAHIECAPGCVPSGPSLPTST